LWPATGQRCLSARDTLASELETPLRQTLMKLANFPIEATDWSSVPAVVQLGETGTASVRTHNLGDITLRIVAYSSGFKADHWCAKGHVVYVISGSLVIEYEDQTHTALSAGMSWHAPDDANPPHRVLCEAGATVFIVD
jgi:quercetin dioxygenase-like cupin family protein